jgi:ubiquinone/menaquinone biosynthesis C-methylase UbiE
MISDRATMSTDFQTSLLSDDNITRIRQVPYFAGGGYHDIDIKLSFDYYTRRFVHQITKFRKIDAATVIADIGTGFGWLAMAFALATPARIVAVDTDHERLDAARQIADILGLSGRIDWRVGHLGALPLRDREAQLSYCIEVLEHTGRAASAARDLARVTSEHLVLTTPNRLFPVVAHDTGLPFCHWLPFAWRRRYAQLCGRTDRENDNLFWSSFGLARCLPEFRIVSSFLHYRSLDDFRATFPIYLPYVGGGMRHRPNPAILAYYRVAALFGRCSIHILPSIAGVFERRE